MTQKLLPDHLEFWESEAYLMREGLERLLGPIPEEVPLDLKIAETEDGKTRTLEFTSETGVRLVAKHLVGENMRWVFVIHSGGMEQAAKSEIAVELLQRGWQVVCPDLRATGTTAIAGEGRGRAPDHNSAQWSLWLGRPLAGQWAHDIRRSILAIQAATESIPEEIHLVGVESAAISTLLAANSEDSTYNLTLIQPLVTYVADVPYERERLGSLIPVFCVTWAIFNI